MRSGWERFGRAEDHFFQIVEEAAEILLQLKAEAADKAQVQADVQYSGRRLGCRLKYNDLRAAPKHIQVLDFCSTIRRKTHFHMLKFDTQSRGTTD
jgi:hypothetical protein